MSEQVVVGVDGSPASYTALRWALACSGRSGARAERELAEVVAAALACVPDGSTRIAVWRSVVRGSAGPVLVGEADGAALLVVGHGPRVAELLRRPRRCLLDHHACPASPRAQTWPPRALAW